MRLKNKVAIVTGANSGLGKEIAKKFLENSAMVVFSDIEDSNIKKIVEENSKQAIFVKCDVSKSEEIKKLINETLDKFKKLDIMVNNAGIGPSTPLVDISDEEWKKVIDINLSGVFYGIREAAKYMLKNKVEGSIINMSSILGEVGFAKTVPYCASKGGVSQLTKATAVELAKNKIRVNAIAPGFIKTEMTKKSLRNPLINSVLKAKTPMGYIGEPEDIANAALYLASDESKYTTGSIIFVDGGWRAQ